jgi:hypothetical protein
MDNKLLQKKLEKFAGFKEIRFKEPPYEVAWVEDEDGHMFTDGVPDLVSSLDAQAEYIYQMLNIYHIQKNFISDTGYWNVDIYKPGAKYEDFFTGYSLHESVAFALACEKIIDSLENNK